MCKWRFGVSKRSELRSLLCPHLELESKTCDSETEWDPVRLPGMEASLSPISCRQDSSLHDLAWVPKGRFEQLLIKGGADKKAPEARVKGPEKLIKIRRCDHRRPCTHPNLVRDPTLGKYCFIKFLIKSSWLGTQSFLRQEPVVSPLPGKVIKLSFSTSPKILSRRFDPAPAHREAELSASIAS